MIPDPPHEFSAPRFDDDPAVAVAEQPDPLATYREKPVVVTGAAGFVGTRACALMVERGMKVRALVRNTAKAAERLGHLDLEICPGDIRDSGSIRSAFRDAGAVVHLAAIAIEKGGERYETTNTHATRNIIECAKAERVERFVHMSQNGADSRSPYRFLQSKGIGEELVKQSGLKWTILRPSVIFGPGDEFVNVLARLVRLSPIVFPLPGGGTARFQPIAVGDVAQAILKCLEMDSSIGRAYDVGGAVPVTLKQMAERILVAMNASRALVGIPVSALRPIIGVLQRILPRPPVTTGLLDLLKVDNVIASNDLFNELGISPVPFAPEELLYLRKISFSDAIRSLM